MKIGLFLLLLLFIPLPVFAAGSFNLPVPHIWEIPDGRWVAPWNGACEEASVMMVERFYLGNDNARYTSRQMKRIMQPLFLIEDRIFGSNSDTNSTRTLKIINDYSSFDATIKKNPTLEDIKTELLSGHPVISLHYGYNLNNPLHRFRRGGSSYHVMVIVGFNDADNKFIVNDPELKNGLDFSYPYDTILGSLRDFNHTTKRADGTPTVLFTTPKQLVRANGAKRIFLVRDGKKYLIITPAAMNSHRLSWSLVKTISKSDLAALVYAGTIEK